MPSERVPQYPSKVAMTHRFFRSLFLKKEQELTDAQASKPGLIGYSPVFMAALFKDLLDLIGIGSLPVIGTIITFLMSLLIFFLLLLTRTNKKLVDSRFLLRMVVVLICGTLIEAFVFGLNFLPIETITIGIIYLMDKSLSDEQIAKALSVIAKLHGEYKPAIRAARHADAVERKKMVAQEEKEAANDEQYDQSQGTAQSPPSRMMDGAQVPISQVRGRAANDSDYQQEQLMQQRAVSGSDIAPAQSSYGNRQPSVGNPSYLDTAPTLSVDSGSSSQPQSSPTPPLQNVSDVTPPPLPRSFPGRTPGSSGAIPPPLPQTNQTWDPNGSVPPPMTPEYGFNEPAWPGKERGLPPPLPSGAKLLQKFSWELNF